MGEAFFGQSVIVVLQKQTSFLPNVVRTCGIRTRCSTYGVLLAERGPVTFRSGVGLSNCRKESNRELPRPLGSSFAPSELNPFLWFTRVFFKMGIPSPEGTGRVQSDDASQRTVSSSDRDVEPISPTGTAGPLQSFTIYKTRKMSSRPVASFPSHGFRAPGGTSLPISSSALQMTFSHGKARFQILPPPPRTTPKLHPSTSFHYQVRGCRTGRLDFKPF